MHKLPETGYLRLSQIIGRKPTGDDPGLPAIIPISASSWWKGVRAGRFPKPVKLGPRMTAWKVKEIRALVERDAA